jgi:hypothetical protein
MMETLLEPQSKSATWVHIPGVRVFSLRPNGRESGVDALQRAIEQGIESEPDTHRLNFFEASIGGNRYYFHVSPAFPPRVYLLARWPET